MLHFYRALSALVPLNWKIQGVGSIISPSTVRIVIVGVQPRFAVRGSLPSNIGRDVIGSPLSFAVNSFSNAIGAGFCI